MVKASAPQVSPKRLAARPVVGPEESGQLALSDTADQLQIEQGQHTPQRGSLTRARPASEQHHLPPGS